MAKLFIPQVGNQLTLISNWNCKVFNEYRNEKVFKGLNIDLSQLTRDTNIDITFPKGTILRVDRLYVRAPASSFDSITFSVVSSPIKSLNKSRFWVKLSEANQIEFEELIIDMDFHKKLKDLYRFVALKNEYPNSERLKYEDKFLVCKEIYDYLSAKNNNVVKIKFKLNAEEFLRTITLDQSYRNSHNRIQYEQERETTLKVINSHLENNVIDLSLSFLPALDGWICFSEPNQISIDIDKELALYGKANNHYWNTKPLGSTFSYNFCDIDFTKKIPFIVENKIENLDNVIFEYQDKPITFKNRKEFDKFLKSIKV